MPSGTPARNRAHSSGKSGASPRYSQSISLRRVVVVGKRYSSTPPVAGGAGGCCSGVGAALPLLSGGSGGTVGDELRIDARLRGGLAFSAGDALGDLRTRIDEVQPDVIVHCQVGLRGYLAARTLAQHGRRVRNLDGGYRTWARI